MSEPKSIDRRAFLGSASAAAAGATLAGAAAPAAASASKAGPRGSSPFPPGFLWGASTAGHQIEGNNASSDLWLLENMKPTIFREPSGDACDSYHRYADDIALLKSTGLNTYRFSLEWARIEPEEGRFSIAQLDYYRRMISAVREAGIKPAVTFSHFSAPRWFAAKGGWENPDAPDLFARYVDQAAKHLADQMHMAFTLNEANAPRLFAWIPKPREASGSFTNVAARMAGVNTLAAKRLGVEHFSTFLTADPDRSLPQLTAAHKRAVAAIKAQRSDLPVGVTLTMQQIDAVGDNSRLDEALRDMFAAWFEATKGDDFLGVQPYMRWRIDDKGTLPGPTDGEVDMRGMEVYPAAVGAVARFAHEKTGLPIYLTESGIATADDRQRVRYIDASLLGVREALQAGVPIKGYMHWSLIDNFEWVFGWTQTFGLAAVDRTTFKRTPKPSLQHLSEIARRNDVLASPANRS
jgi:beta-glucosidase